jgi:hypothetical protein
MLKFLNVHFIKFCSESKEWNIFCIYTSDRILLQLVRTVCKCFPSWGEYFEFILKEKSHEIFRYQSRSCCNCSKLLQFGSTYACLLNLFFVTNFSVFASQYSYFTLWLALVYYCRRSAATFVLWHVAPYLEFTTISSFFSLYCHSTELQNKEKINKSSG